MESTEKFILSEDLNKSSKNENMSLNAVISGNRKLLPDDGIGDKINMYDLYLKERKESNKFRIVLTINPYCTNVLFNPFTEIVKEYYDENNVFKRILLNYELEGGKSGITGTVGKDNSYHWTAYDAIRDTQLSNDKCGFTYYCGLDIFNNHILRNKSLKAINYSDYSETPIYSYESIYGRAGYEDRTIEEDAPTSGHIYLIPEDFNTIDDYMRDRNGVIVSDYHMTAVKRGISSEKHMSLHVYDKGDAYSFKDAINEKLVENNGWYGFYNPSTINPISYSNLSENNDNTTGSLLNINKTINNRKYKDFIDMYPSRELFSFSPLFNKRKNRYENNWNYCLTYPSSSITKDFEGKEFPFFEHLEDDTYALKAVSFDEYTVGDNGRDLLTIYSICKHGLKEGDSVNIYKTYKNASGETINELVYINGTVVNIVDKFIFQVYKEAFNISNAFVNVDEIEWNGSTTTISGNTYYYDGKFLNSDEGSFRVLESKRCNIDTNAQNISFKRVVNNVECEYYVRVFSRLPNFKFAGAEINDYNLYENKDLDLIKKYSYPNAGIAQFENHISKLSFAGTAYGDDATEIVFTDDIDTSFLKDNLGRPLSEIYFTLVKNNKGYKEWYSGDIDNDEIEFSHCFGYMSSSFLFNEYYRQNDYLIDDVRDINASSRKGLRYVDYGDEIVFDELVDFYGDICCYSQVECDETILQDVMCRFNTVQRELANYPSDLLPDGSFWEINAFSSLPEDIDYPGTMFHDEIVDDDYFAVENVDDRWEAFNENPTLYHSTYHLPNYKVREYDKNDYKLKNMLDFKEGYYYKMHYKIPLKTISMSINKDEGITYDLFSIEASDGDLLIKTVYENGLTINDKLTLYNKTKNKFYYLTVTEIYTKFYFKCSVKNENLSEGFEDEIDRRDEVSLIKRGLGTPEYAKLIKDGSCRYYWREVLSNGIEQNDSKIYPFTNGAFYINRNINFYLRRQDPEKQNLAAIPTAKNRMDYVSEGEFLPDSFYETQYYDSEEIKICED